MSSKGTLFLVPNGLGGPLQEVLPNTNANAIAQVEHFVIESFKGGRSLIKQLGKNPDEAKSIELLNEHSKVEDLRNLLNPALQGNSIALMSDAGCPAIADPGAGLVSLAHELGIPVVPLVGPSSILLALMGSGFNGQQFTFNGYLPKEPRERTKTVQHLLRLALQGNTQLFMETPYRNTKLLEEIGQMVSPDTKLLIACNLTLPDSILAVKTLADWQKTKPDIHKKPCIFGFGTVVRL